MQIEFNHMQVYDDPLWLLLFLKLFVVCVFVM